MNSWRGFLDLLEPAEMYRADAAAVAAGISSFSLMEAAGAAVADEAARLVLPKSRATPRVSVLCGPGSNGGDGFVAARLLCARGFDVRVFLIGARLALHGDARAAAEAWRGDVAALDAFDPAQSDLVIDALFGAGLTRQLQGIAKDTVERVNQWRVIAGGRVLAVDVPTGLDGRTGQVRGTAIKADATVTFFRLKPGHLLYPGRGLCGDLRLAQIGIDADVLAAIRPLVSLNSPSLWLSMLPHPKPEGHKYLRGHALVMSGAAGKTGAARLAARAALRTGAGLVTIAAPPDAMPEVAAHLTAIMLAACASASDLVRILADARLNAIVLGPGLGTGPDSRDLVAAALAPAAHRGAVLDADALTIFSGDASGLARAIRDHLGPVVLTPHEGEFTRLFSKMGAPVESVSEAADSSGQAPDSKLEKARSAARITGSVVLLKGPDTVVASPDGRASITTDLPPDLATAGSGDVLAGTIGGLLAQGMPAFEAACAAAWMHGAAGAVTGRGLIAEDLPDALPGVLAQWRTL